MTVSVVFYMQMLLGGEGYQGYNDQAAVLKKIMPQADFRTV